MRPIVNGLEEDYTEQMSFVYLDARDNASGQAAYEEIALRGHPGIVIYTPDGEEQYRRIGQVDEDTLRQAVSDVLETTE